MQVTQEQIAALLKLQAIDSECARLNKQLDELPQKMAILDVRHKKAALAEKRRTIVGMHKDTQTQLAHAEGEDADLARKSKVAQDLIDTAGSDYRSITLHSKELSGYQKRRDTLVDEIAGDKEKLAQMEKLEGEIDTIEASLCAKEEKLIAEYRAKGSLHGGIRSGTARVGRYGYVSFHGMHVDGRRRRCSFRVREAWDRRACMRRSEIPCRA